MQNFFEPFLILMMLGFMTHGHSDLYSQKTKVSKENADETEYDQYFLEYDNRHFKKIFKDCHPDHDYTIATPEGYDQFDCEGRNFYGMTKAETSNWRSRVSESKKTIDHLKQLKKELAREKSRIQYIAILKELEEKTKQIFYYEEATTSTLWWKFVNQALRKLEKYIKASEEQHKFLVDEPIRFKSMYQLSDSLRNYEKTYLNDLMILENKAKNLIALGHSDLAKDYKEMLLPLIEYLYEKTMEIRVSKSKKIFKIARKFYKILFYEIPRYKIPGVIQNFELLNTMNPMLIPVMVVFLKNMGLLYLVEEMEVISNLISQNKFNVNTLDILKTTLNKNFKDIITFSNSQ